MSISKIFNFRLSKKIPFIIILFSFLVATGISFVIFSSAKKDLTIQYKNVLFSVMKNKSGELTAYLNSLEADMKFLSAAPQTKKSIARFSICLG